MIDADAEVAVVLGLRHFEIAEVSAVEDDALGVALHPADAELGAEFEVRLGHFLHKFPLPLRGSWGESVRYSPRWKDTPCPRWSKARCAAGQGRWARVRSRDLRRRQRSISAWWPERSTSGATIPPVLSGPGVEGVLQQSGGDGVSGHAFRRADHAGEQAGDCVDDNHGGQFAAGQHVVADADLPGCQPTGDALVHPGVVAAD